MLRNIFLILSVCCTLLVTAQETPDVLVIDDFETGIDKWENDDTGKLEWVDGPEGQGKVIRWTAADDGIGHISFRNLDKSTIDFSQYQLLSFRIKLEGKPAWNINPIIQQYPAVYGYRGLFYSIDTLMPFGEWFEYTQDLRRWENAWPNTFSRDAQEFQFEITQLAGAGVTRVSIDDVRLLKNPIGLEPSYVGLHAKLDDGSQVSHFNVALTNSGTSPITLQAVLREPVPATFEVTLPPPVRLLPGETRQALVRVLAPAAVLAEKPAWYAETAIVGFRAEEIPGLTLYTELLAGSRPDVVHPSILATPDRMAAWRKTWNDPATRDQVDRLLSDMVKVAEKQLSREPQFPLLAQTGIRNCLKDNAKLIEIQVEDAPFHSYQCPTCGQPYSGDMFDAGMQNWLGEHLANGHAVRAFGIAYAVTKRPEFAEAAARILRRYIEVYPQLPYMAVVQGSPVYSRTSGAARIGGTFMRERTWLTNMAIGLDFIHEAEILTPDELVALRQNVFEPSGHSMMDHKVGAMNLQWMIVSSGLYAGMASESPSLVGRALYGTHGVHRLMKVGYLPDGNWWENPSYQNVAAGIAFPVLATCIHNGLIPWTADLKPIFTAQFRVYAPDGRGPTLGTGGPGGWNYSINALHSLGSLLDDPELAWVPHHTKIWRAGGPGAPYDSYLWAATWQSMPAMAAADTVSPIPTGTLDFPHYGGIALRLPETSAYCYFNYGRELVHGHRNKLSINAFAHGEWYVRNIAGGYGDNFTNFLETIGSSTSVMVDGKSPDWDTGEKTFHKTVDGMELASARELGAWKDVEHERSIALTPDVLIVIDRLQADAPHRYDWLYQTSGTKLDLVRDGLAAHDTALGETPIYESLVPENAFGDLATASFSRKDGSGLTIAWRPEGQRFAFGALRKKEPGILWRQEGTTVGFAAALHAYPTGGSAAVALEMLTVTDAAGKTVDLNDGQAVRVTTASGVWTVLVNYSGAALTAGPLTSTDRVAIHTAK